MSETRYQFTRIGDSDYGYIYEISDAKLILGELPVVAELQAPPTVADEMEKLLNDAERYKTILDVIETLLREGSEQAVPYGITVGYIKQVMNTLEDKP